MNARQQLGQLLRDHLPADAALTVEDAPRIPSPVGASYVGSIVIQREKIEPAPNRQGVMISEFSLWVFVATRSADQFEDDLDDALDATIAAIESIGSFLLWESAERDAIPDEDGVPTYHGYRVTLKVATSKE